MFSRVHRNPAPQPAPAAQPAPAPVAAPEIAGVAALQDTLEVAQVPGHFEVKMEPNEKQLQFLVPCAGFQNGRVSVDLSPQFWEFLEKSGTKVIEQELVDAMLLAGVHASAAVSAVELFKESGTEEGRDLAAIEAQVKAARSALENYKEGGKCNVGGTSRRTKKAYAKANNECKMDLDHSAYKASQRFREKILNIAAMPANKRDFEVEQMIKEQPKLAAAIVIALYRLNRSFA